MTNRMWVRAAIVILLALIALIAIRLRGAAAGPSLARHLDPGEIADVIGRFPDDLKELWPLEARTSRERAH